MVEDYRAGSAEEERMWTGGFEGVRGCGAPNSLSSQIGWNVDVERHGYFFDFRPYPYYLKAAMEFNLLDEKDNQHISNFRELSLPRRAVAVHTAIVLRTRYPLFLVFVS